MNIFVGNQLIWNKKEVLN